MTYLSLPSHSVDLVELADVVGDLARATTTLEGLGSDLDRASRTLHHSWQGAAADQHLVAQAGWNAGLRGLRDALDRLRSAAGLAHGNYTRAVTANDEMWDQVL